MNKKTKVIVGGVVLAASAIAAALVAIFSPVDNNFAYSVIGLVAFGGLMIGFMGD